MLLDAVDGITGSQTNWPNQPMGTRAIQLPDDSYNKRAYFLEVFGKQADSASACTCERQMMVTSQSLMPNPDDVQNKLGTPRGIADQLSKDANRTDEDKLNDYLTAYARPAAADEAKFATDFITCSKTAANVNGRKLPGKIFSGQ